MSSINTSKQIEDWQQDRIQHLKRLLQIYHKNLNYTEEQIACNFSSPSLALLNQRDQLNEAIVTAKSELVSFHENIDFSAPTPLTRQVVEPALWFYAGKKLIDLVELEALNWAEPVFLGRSRDCQVVIRSEYPQVSRRHALLIKVNNSYLLKDNHSRFGTYVNRVEIDHEQGKIFADGDQVSLGSPGNKDLVSRQACIFEFHVD